MINFNKAILIVAHPDDEILWFSSILESIGEVLICFLNSRSHPDWGIGREQTLSEYPMKNISCLGLDESEAFMGARWERPLITNYGLEISERGIPEIKYVENYHRLKNDLREKLKKYPDVVTHNPWGEYGHEDHVQVYRVVKELQEEMKFNLWYSNYCSNVSMNLMVRYVSGFGSDYITLKTNIELAAYIKKIYMKNRSWTWFDEWVWFHEESIKKDEVLEDPIQPYGHIFPLNFIKYKPPSHPKKKGPMRTLFRKSFGI